MLNRPIVRTFNWCSDHPESGLSGWQLPGWEDLIPSADFGVAHDACEHFDLTLGLDAECLALGAIYYGRVPGGFWRRQQKAYQQNPADILGREFVLEFVDENEGRWSARGVPNCRRIDQLPSCAKLGRHIVAWCMQHHFDWRLHA